jgi:ABC-type branched-subunit amino acid transport system substrate-binding protein
MAAALAAAALAAAPEAGGGEERKPPAPGPASAPEDPTAPGPSTYGGVPAEVSPWRRWGTPYERYFVREVEFRGGGREDPEPTGLASIRVGLLAPLRDHPDAPLGIAMRDGVALAVEEANAAGGFRGTPFELVARNDLPLWGASSNSIVDLAYGENVWAILGSVEGNSTHILLRAALKIEIPVVNTADTDPTLMETNIPWILRVIPDDRQECYRLFRHCWYERGFRRMAVLRGNERYGRIAVPEFADSYRRMGAPVVADLRYCRGGVLPVGTAEKLRDARADAVLLWGNAEDLGRVLRALREAGLDLPVVGCDRMLGEAFPREAGPAAEGATAACFYDPEREDADWQAFRARFRARYGKGPDAYAAYGYDGAALLLDCIRKGGLNRVRIRDAMFAPREWKGVTGPMRFDPAKSNLVPAALARFRGGRWVHEK